MKNNIGYSDFVIFYGILSTLFFIWCIFNHRFILSLGKPKSIGIIIPFLAIASFVFNNAEIIEALDTYFKTNFIKSESLNTEPNKMLCTQKSNNFCIIKNVSDYDYHVSETERISNLIIRESLDNKIYDPILGGIYGGLVKNQVEKDMYNTIHPVKHLTRVINKPENLFKEGKLIRLQFCKGPEWAKSLEMSPSDRVLGSNAYVTSSIELASKRKIVKLISQYPIVQKGLSEYDETYTIPLKPEDLQTAAKASISKPMDFYNRSSNSFKQVVQPSFKDPEKIKRAEEHWKQIKREFREQKIRDSICKRNTMKNCNFRKFSTRGEFEQWRLKKIHLRNSETDIDRAAYNNLSWLKK